MATARSTETSVTLDTVIIFSPNMVELAAFYQEGFQWGDPQAQGDAHLGFPLPNLYFGIDRIEAGVLPAPGATTIWFEVDDLDATYERFVSSGAGVRYGPTRKPWGAILASLTDLDGNWFGLSQRLG